MKPSFVFLRQGRYYHCGPPDKTLRAFNAEQLRLCLKQAEAALADGYAFVAGLLPYEAGEWLQGVADSGGLAAGFNPLSPDSGPLSPSPSPARGEGDENRGEGDLGGGSVSESLSPNPLFASLTLRAVSGADVLRFASDSGPLSPNPSPARGEGDEEDRGEGDGENSGGEGCSGGVYPVVLHLYRAVPVVGLPDAGEAFALRGPFRAEQGREAYLARLRRVQDYLLAGDCYQVNLSQRFRADFTGSPYTAWRRLQQAHPAPHAGFFDTGQGAVFGVSPERFLAIEGNRVTTEPIKGSRPRGATPAKDAQLARDLRHHPKDRAENLMIVDLLRNDLGVFCEPGSIRTEPLFQLRRFSNVQHLVSTIEGRLAAGVSPLSALLSAFPGGSITGAPKKRAMEIIQELEPVPRHAYCGSLFWMDQTGNLDSSILIRTLQTHGQRLYCHGGGGVVHDSIDHEEYRESLFKVEKLMAALEQAPSSS